MSEWPLLTIAFGILALIVSYGLYLRSSHPRPTALFYTTPLIGVPGSLSKLTVQYDGEPVRRLSRTVVGLWNAGRKTIHGADLAAGDPLRCEVKEGEVLEVNVLSVTRDVIQFAAMVREGGVRLSFDFVDRSDGAIFELLHTGRKPQRAILFGTIKGRPKGIRQRVAEAPGFHTTRRRARKAAFAFLQWTFSVLFSFWFLAIAVAGRSRLLGATGDEVSLGARTFAGLFGLLFAASAVLMLYIWLSFRVPRRLKVTD